jgi:hypothetical protein
MFDLDFVNTLRQALRDNLWPLEPINQDYRTCLLGQVEYLLGTNKAEKYSLVKTTHKKWLKNEKENMKITWRMDVVGQTTISSSNCGIKKNDGHHRMFVIVGTHLNEDHHKNCKYSFFAIILNVLQTIHALVKKKS